MTFRNAFYFLTWATAFWAFVVLAVTALLHIPAIIAFLIVFGLAIYRKRLNIRIPHYVEVGISLLALVLALYGWFVVQERMYSVIYLFLYLEIYKLWTAEKNRDYLQIYALTFFQILAASVSTASFFFAPALVVYLFLILAALITTTVKSDAERAFARRGRRADGPGDPVRVTEQERRRIERLFGTEWLNRNFYRWLTVTLVVILVIGMGIFFIIPRLQAQSFFSGLGAAQTNTMQSGFSDGIDFSQVGEIQNDPTIAMRAIPERGYPLDPNGRPAIDVLRLRGTALDEYDGRRWRKSDIAYASIDRFKGRRHEFMRSEAFRRGEGVDQRITRILLEPNRKGYLFGPDRSHEYRFESEVLLRNDELNHSLQLQAENWGGPLSYYTESTTPRTDWQLQVSSGVEDTLPGSIAEGFRRGRITFRNELASLLSPMLNDDRDGISQQTERLYLQLPEHPDIDTVRDVAEEWVGSISDPKRIADTIETRLKSRFGYSTENDFSDAPNHLTIFLEQEREGHCEYFATTMALMLRTRGIPARVVNGYATDEWSGTGGGYYLVRQEHAHSWVEAWFRNAGWITYDPTPLSGIGSQRIENSLYRRITAWIDGLKLMWYQAVIDYDMDDQRFLYIMFFRGMDALSNPGELLGLESGGSGGASRTQKILLLLIMVPIIIVVLYLIRREVKKIKRGKKGVKLFTNEPIITQEETLRPYLDLLKEMDQIQRRPPADTPLEYANRVTMGRESLGDFLPLTESYYDARFNGHRWSDAEAKRAHDLIKIVKEEISAAGKKAAAKTAK